MLLKRYIDFELEDNTVIQNMKLEVDIPKEDILTISPMLNKYGAKLKQVSLLQDRYGNQYRVVGNYKDFIEEIRGRTKVKGY